MQLDVISSRTPSNRFSEFFMSWMELANMAENSSSGDEGEVLIHFFV